jgi:hypothetical protein
VASLNKYLKALFVSLEERGGEGLGGRKIKRKVEKSSTCVAKVFIIENDK